MSADDSSPPPAEAPTTQGTLTQEERIKTLARVVCICKGITLGRVLKVLPEAETVLDVNRLAGTGNGGCRGERCGPRIKLLLKKQQQLGS